MCSYANFGYSKDLQVESVCCKLSFNRGPVAQLVEHQPCKLGVQSSNLCRSTIFLLSKLGEAKIWMTAKGHPLGTLDVFFPIQTGRSQDLDDGQEASSNLSHRNHVLGDRVLHPNLRIVLYSAPFLFGNS